MYNRLLFKHRENIPATCRMEEKKLVYAFRRNTSSFQQLDKHSILLSLVTSSAKFISLSFKSLNSPTAKQFTSVSITLSV